MARRRASTGSWLRWLTPGLQIKRWLLLLMASELVLVLGVAYALKEVYQTIRLPGIFFYITLQFWPYWARATIFVIVGVGLLVISYLKLTQSVLGPFLPGNSTSSVVEIIHAFRLRGRGPRSVAIGGGTGLSSLLRVWKPVHHGDGRRHRKLRAGSSRIREGARRQGHNRSVHSSGRHLGRLHQRGLRRGRVQDPEAKRADQPRVPQAGRRAGQPRSGAGNSERRADHRRTGLALHVDPSQPPGGGNGRSDQGLARAEALHLQRCGAAG